MNARSRALVPLSTEQQAAWRAVAETEKRRHQGNTLAEYPYAGAFFRCLNGSRRISLSDLRFFMPSLTAEELHGNRLQWLCAIDVLIETQGEVCLLPLPGDAAERLFPSVRFRVRERSRHKSALVMQKYSRQQAREAEQKARAYQALVAQAEIELAFHSPETVGSWHARWSDRVAEHDLETLFWQWGERFPSLAGMERWQWQDMPFWQVIAEASLAAREAGHAVREMERRYSLRWKLPYPCPGEHELVSEVVEAGQPAPASVMSRWVAGAGYAVCLDFISDRPVRRWSEERKAAVRRRNLEKRINRHAPLFADELIARELAERPDYFQGK